MQTDRNTQATTDETTGERPSWKQLRYAVTLFCQLSGLDVPADKAAMRPFIGRLKEMAEQSGGSSDAIPF